MHHRKTRSLFRRALALAASSACASSMAHAQFRLQVLHASDLEGGVDAIGRAANFAAIVDALENDTGNFDASVLLSAGDNYIPGPFFNAAGDFSFRASGVFNDTYNTLFGVSDYDSLREGNGRVDISIMNVLGFDASALGNHEFDATSDGLENIIEEDFRGGADGPAGDRWVGAQFPYLSANLNFASDPDLFDLHTAALLRNTDFTTGPAESLSGGTAFPKIAPFTVIERAGQPIGVIGATTQLLEQISSPTGTEVAGAGAGTNDMQALADVLNPQIAALRNGLDGSPGGGDDIDKIILVSHLQQIALETDLIGRLIGVDIVIAGGSDTLLADANDSLRAGDVADAAYPVFATNLDGDPAVIVSTDGEYSYVGRLVVEFDGAGVLTAPTVAEGAGDPNLSGTFATDEAGVLAATGAADLAAAIAASTKATEVEKLSDAVSAVVTDKDGTVFGRTGVFIEGRRDFVRTEETNMGNLTADANLWFVRQMDPTVQVSLKNGGGIRAEIGQVDGFTGELYPAGANPTAGKAEGEISQLDIENTLRFDNELSLVTVSASELVQILEHGVAATAAGATPGQFPQVGGVSFSFDPGLAPGTRVRSVALIDELGNVIDAIRDGGMMIGDPSRQIRMVTLNFLAGGGDGYHFDPDADGDSRLDTGIGEQEALGSFLAEFHSEVPYYTNDTPIAWDRRIQNLAHRGDSVLSEMPTRELPLKVVSQLELDGSEISAFDPLTNTFFVTSGDGLQIVDYSDPYNPVYTGLIDATSIEGAGFNNTEFTSVAVYNGAAGNWVAAALPNINPENGDDKTLPGDVLLFDTAGTFIRSFEVGSLPDMVTFAANGWILVANEGESAGDENQPDGFENPNGSVSIIDVVGEAVNTFDFTDASITFEALDALGVRVNPNAPSAAADLEPEYITLSGNQAFITLQENNAVAVIDDITTFAGFTIDAILPLGLVDHTLPSNALDPSNRDGGIHFRNVPVFGQFMPDAIASYEVGGQTYFVVANEGDGRDVDETRIGDFGDEGEAALDAGAVYFAAALQEGGALGRLKASNVQGDTDGDGDIDDIHVFGTRSFSIFDAAGNLVHDSGSLFERHTARAFPELFNSDESDPDEFDERSDDKGPEPEGVALGVIDGRTYAFVGLERVGGIMIFDVSDPAAVQFVDYILIGGDAGPEGITFIPAADSPTGAPLMVITNEVSNTLTTIEIAPALIVEVNADAIRETDGAGATTATVTRNTLPEMPLAVALTSDDTSEADVPAMVTIPAGQRSFTFPVDAVDDGVVDGPQVAGITAMAADHNPGDDRVIVSEGGGVRFATYNASLNRGDAGDLIADLSTPGDPQAQQVAQIIQANAPDVILINEFDYDAAGMAADRFRSNYLEVAQGGEAPVLYPFVYLAPVNTGVASGFDLDNNGAVGGPGDAQGFGFFEGQFGMVLFSKFPILEGEVRTFQNFLWKDMPGALLPADPADADGDEDTGSWYTEEELDALRLSSKSHWDIPIDVDGTVIHVLAAHPTPPVFDGPEDRNGTRNHDEIRFWADYIDPDESGYIYDDSETAETASGGLGEGERFVILGDYNSDPFDGDSIPGAANQLTGHSLINNSVAPSSIGGVAAAMADGGINLMHVGDPALDTSDFGEPPGNLRVDYALPAADLRIVGAKVFWPAAPDPRAALVAASDHRLVAVDLDVRVSPEFMGVPSDIAVATEPGTSAAVVDWVPPTASDDLEMVGVEQIEGPPPGSSFGIGVTTITYEATDAAGNSVTASFTVTVTVAPGEMLAADAMFRGEAAPGVEGVFDGFDEPFLSRTGQLLVKGSAGGADGVWKGTVDSMGLVAHAGSTVLPGTGGVIAGFDRAHIADNGNAAFRARLAGEGIDRSNDSGVWHSDDALSEVAVAGNAAPDPGSTFQKIWIEGQVILADGEVLAIAQLDKEDGVSVADDSGIWSGAAGLLLREGEDADGAGGDIAYGQLGRQLGANDAGGATFVSHLVGDGVTSANNTALFAGDLPGGLDVVAREGDAAPGGDEFDQFTDDQSMNGGGAVLFSARLRGEAVTPDDNFGVYTDAGGSLVLVAREGDAAPGYQGEEFAEFDSLFICDDGTCYLRATVRGGAVEPSSTEDSAIYAWTPGVGLELLVREGDLAPGSSGVFRNFGTTAIGAERGGDLGFNATLQSGVGGVTRSDDTGVWVRKSGAAAALLIRKGDEFELGDNTEVVKRVYIADSPDGGTAARSSSLGGGNIAVVITFDNGAGAGVFVLAVPAAGAQTPGQ